MHGSLTLGRKNKRKYGIFLMREPNGRLSRSHSEPSLENCSPTQVKRLRDAALAEMQDPEWGTELGRLFLSGRITASQFSAGKWFAMLSDSCRAAIDAPSMPHKAGFVKGSGGHAPDPDSDAGRVQVARDREAVEKFMQAHAALIGAGMLAERAVRMVCEDGKTIENHSQLLGLQNGLEWLCEYRRLTAAQKHVR